MHKIYRSPVQAFQTAEQSLLLKPEFSSSDHHRAVRREAVLLHCSDNRPVVVVRVHRRGGAAVGTGESRATNTCLLTESKEHVAARKRWICVRFVATNCCLSHFYCCRVTITTIAMVMNSAHESSATPVYELRGKTNPACRFLCG